MQHQQPIAEAEYDEAQIVGQCTYCGDPIDYCEGHDAIADSEGFIALLSHDDGDHSLCHRDGCRFAPLPRHERPSYISTRRNPSIAVFG